MNDAYFYEYPLKAGGKVRGISITGLRAIRIAMGLSGIPGPFPGEDPKEWRKRIDLKKVHEETLKLASPDVVSKILGDVPLGLIK